MTHTSHSPDQTCAIAADLARQLPPGTVLALHGELGSGKTCFVRGLARALGVTQPVTSPTFTLINEYRSSPPLAHIDLYRLNSPDEALALGLEEYLEPEGITVIEWAERAGDLLPAHTRHIEFEALAQPDHRRIRIS